MSSSRGQKLSTRPSHRIDVENEMIKRREKEMRHQVQWGGQVKYYKTFEKKNHKFEEWTSPRYYENNTQQWSQLKKSRDKEELLEKRREKMKKLFAEEANSYQIELMVKNSHKLLTPREKPDDIPTEILKDVNLGLKIEEDDRRRHEAEINLYHQWRNNNPVVKHYERIRNLKNTKLSWLDQQIEKRMNREKSEEECRKMLAERDRRLREEKLKEEQFKREIEVRNEDLKRDLERQCKELENKQRQSEILKRKEEEELMKRIKFLELDEMRKENDRQRKEREVALHNIRQHKIRLKQRAQDVRENLKTEKEIIELLLKYEVVEQLKDYEKKKEIKETMQEFLKFTKEQDALEQQRQKHFQFIFDSESKVMFEKQSEIWVTEQASRRQLLEDVMSSIKEQIEQNVQNTKEKQKELLMEREEMLKCVESYNEEMQKLKQEEVNKKIEFRKTIDEQIRERSRKKMELENLEQRNVDRELENVRKEEERLKNEIMKLQMKQGPNYRRTRSKLFK